VKLVKLLVKMTTVESIRTGGWLHYPCRDLAHFSVNLPLILTVLIPVYVKVGFLGWIHLASVLCIYWSGFLIDDWLEASRRFPLQSIPLVSFSAVSYPIVTGLALVGILLVNIRTMLRLPIASTRSGGFGRFGRFGPFGGFLLERVEGLGNLLVIFIPVMVPAGLVNTRVMVAAVCIILFIDSFHKIAHGETSSPRLLAATGLVGLAAATLIYAPSTFLFLPIVLLLTAPFFLWDECRRPRPVRTRRSFWYYQGVFQTGVCLCAFVCYLFLCL